MGCWRHVAGATRGLDRLLDLDGFLAEIGAGFWVKMWRGACRPMRIRPQGVSYTLTLHDPGGRRVFGIDNARVVRLSRGPAARYSEARDHVHRDETVRSYTYRNANALLDDFWREVEAILKREGVE